MHNDKYNVICIKSTAFLLYLPQYVGVLHVTKTGMCNTDIEQHISNHTRKKIITLNEDHKNTTQSQCGLKKCGLKECINKSHQQTISKAHRTVPLPAP